MSGNNSSDVSISDRLADLRNTIRMCADEAGRQPDDLRLIAVSKTRDVQEVQAAADAGQRDFGENYLQEALPKIEALKDQGLAWHFLGPIQSNKTRDIAGHFDWVHSVDRPRIARRLSAGRPDSLPPLNVLVQVNIGGEAAKAGVSPDAAAPELCADIAALPQLRLRGLMAIPPAETEPARQRAHFDALRRLRDDIVAQGITLPELSMGMSADYPEAIHAGATMLRIGTAIFGPRAKTR